VSALRDDLPFVKDDDPGSEGNRFRMVRNQECRPPGHELLQGLGDLVMRGVVKVRGRLVED